MPFINFEGLLDYVEDMVTLELLLFPLKRKKIQSIFFTIPGPLTFQVYDVSRRVMEKYGDRVLELNPSFVSV